MRDRLYIKKSFRDSLIDKMINDKLLGFDVLERKDMFILAVSLGLDNPQPIVGAKDGFFLLENKIHTFEKSLFGCLLIGKAKPDEDIDQYTDIEKCYSRSEECAEQGFQNLLDILNEAQWDEENLEDILLLKLETLYEKNINANL